MNSPIVLCRDYLEGRYKALLGNSEHFADSLSAGSYVWCDVRPGDKMLPKDASEAGGMLMDSEIGVVLFLLHFRKGQDITAQFIHGLGIRSRLLPESHYAATPDPSSDPYGSWRVVLHWFAEREEDKQDWLQQIAKIRGETAHLEEIPVDLICQEGFHGWTEAFEQHGFPRLLLQTRAVFRRRKHADVATWLSADTLVRAGLTNFSKQFADNHAKGLAEEVVRQMQGFEQNVGTVQLSVSNTEVTPLALESLSLRHFRNIRQMDLQLVGRGAGAVILHGPNGTGKSSIFEALALTIFKSSRLYQKFLEDPDITIRNRTSEYHLVYLRPIHAEPGETPNIKLNGETANLSGLVNSPDAALQAEAQADGTMLSQEMSQDFANMPADKLGARILAGYSDLANNIERFVDNATDRAHQERQSFLRSLGLNASITKINTAWERIAQRMLNGNEMPRLPGDLVKWLEIADSIEHPDYRFAGRLASAWRAWGDEAVKTQMASELAARPEEEVNRPRLEMWLTRYNGLIDESAAAMLRLEGGNVSSVQRQADRLTELLRSWASWLTQVTNVPPPNASAEIEVLKKQVMELQKRQQAIVAEGKFYRGRLEHFGQIDRFLREDWEKHHPNECPTCGTDLTTRQGIRAVVDSLRKETEASREDALRRFNEITTTSKAIQDRLSSMGQKQCPVSPEDQAMLVQVLQWLLPSGQLLSEWIKDEAQREKLIKEIDILRLLPKLPAKVDAQTKAIESSKAFVDQCVNASKVFRNPDAWKSVQDALSKVLGGIVARHLPDTLGRLWQEMVMNLTSAPWLLPERLALQVKTKRGEQRVEIRLGDDNKSWLARYVLNSAEVHILGLAWFFVRYLTFGRFRYALMVMDDPAQEMDQATYRDLCRLWETYLRLHKVANRPLCLFVMLHQEERALDAARATGGELKVLGWGKDQMPATIHDIQLLGEGFSPRQPIPAVIEAI